MCNYNIQWYMLGTKTLCKNVFTNQDKISISTKLFYKVLKDFYTKYFSCYLNAKLVEGMNGVLDFFQKLCLINLLLHDK